MKFYKGNMKKGPFPVVCCKIVPLVRVHDNSSKDTSSNTTISLQRQLVYYDSLSNATLSLLLFSPTTSGRKIS